MNIVSPSFPKGIAALRTEAEVRAKRAALKASMQAEGAPEAMIERLATDETAAKMLDYERKTIDLITSLFGPRT